MNRAFRQRAATASVFVAIAPVVLGAECGPPSPALDYPMAVHSGLAWQAVAGGQARVVFRDNPPLAGRVSLGIQGGVLAAHSPGLDGLPNLFSYTSPRVIVSNYLYENVQFRISGPTLSVRTDAVHVGDLPIAPWGDTSAVFGRPNLDNFRWRSNGVQLRPGVSTPVVLERRSRVGDSDKGFDWIWEPVDSGSLRLHQNVRVLDVVVAVLNIDNTDGSRRIVRTVIDPSDTRDTFECLTAPADAPCKRNRFDARDAQAWFDGRTVDHRVVTSDRSTGQLGSVVFDRDVRSVFEITQATSNPTLGRLPQYQDPDEIFSQCAQYTASGEGRVVQFRLRSFEQNPVATTELQERCRNWPLGTGGIANSSICLDNIRDVLVVRGVDIRPSTIVVVVSEDYRVAGEESETSSTLIVGLAGIATTRLPFLLAHELGHSLGLPHIIQTGNLMAEGPAGGRTLGAAQCETVYANAASRDQWTP